MVEEADEELLFGPLPDGISYEDVEYVTFPTVDGFVVYVLPPDPDYGSLLDLNLSPEDAIREFLEKW